MLQMSYMLGKLENMVDMYYLLLDRMYLTYKYNIMMHLFMNMWGNQGHNLSILLLVSIYVLIYINNKYYWNKFDNLEDIIDIY